MDAIALTLVVVGLTAFAGLGLGALKIKNVGLEIAGVVFTGILAGHLVDVHDIALSMEAMSLIQQIGLILFVYTVGIEVGPGFFASLRKSGLRLNMLAAGIVFLCMLMTVGFAFFLDGGIASALGLFAGSAINTPSLGAAQQALRESSAAASTVAQPVLSYVVSYPFGVVGAFLAMAILRRLFKADLKKEADQFLKKRQENIVKLETHDILVSNPNIVSVPLKDLPGFNCDGLVVTRILRDEKVEVPKPETEINAGDIVRIVGPRKSCRDMHYVLGKTIQAEDKMEDADVRWARVVVTDSHILGKSLRALDLLGSYGAVVCRVSRAGMDLPPALTVRLQFGDILTVVGTKETLEQVSDLMGNAEKLLQYTQLAPIFIGIVLGVLLGVMPIPLPGVPAPIHLGLAGGPLIVAILLGRLGHLGPLVWFIPPSVNRMLREIGLVLYLAVVGMKAGAPFFTVMESGIETGLVWMGLGVALTLLPLLIGGIIARTVLKVNFLSVCGMLAGAVTNGASLAYLNQGGEESDAPILAYSAVYPLVTFLRILVPQILVIFLL